jgi:hypothetical protein
MPYDHRFSGLFGWSLIKIEGVVFPFKFTIHSLYDTQIQDIDIDNIENVGIIQFFKVLKSMLPYDFNEKHKIKSVFYKMTDDDLNCLRPIITESIKRHAVIKSDNDNSSSMDTVELILRLKIKHRLSEKDILYLSPMEIRKIFEIEKEDQLSFLKNQAILFSQSTRNAYHAKELGFNQFIRSVETLSINKEPGDIIDEDIFNHLEKQFSKG